MVTPQQQQLPHLEKLTVEFPKESKGDSGVINETGVLRIEPNPNNDVYDHMN